MHKYRVASNEKLAPGKYTIKFDSKYDGPGMGKSGLTASDSRRSKKPTDTSRRFAIEGAHSSHSIGRTDRKSTTARRQALVPGSVS